MSDQPPHKLDGWKAIADYLGRDERTAQRWHKTRGMPVHHVPGGKGTVFAFGEELDIWLTKPAPLRTSAPAADFSAVVAPEAEPPAEYVDGTPAPDSRQPASRRVAWTLGTALLTVVGVLALQRLMPFRAEAPERVEVREKTLVALDRSQAVVWSYDLLPDMRNHNSSSAALTVPLSTGNPFRSIDFDRDGDNEIIAVVQFFGSGGTSGPNVVDVVYCFSSEGLLVWRYSPKTTLTFADGRFDGPWHIRDWIAVSDRRGVSLWATFIHHTWWPSFVVALDYAGQPKIQFVNRGHVTSLAAVQDSQGSWVFAAGVNNAFSAGALAVLDANGAPAVARLSGGSALLCDACPTGDPERYFVFPRSELNQLTGNAVNYPYSLVVTDEGKIEVSIREVDAQPTSLRTIYRLSRFTVESVAMSDPYWETHRRFEREGKLTHSFETCPERLHGKMVKIWQADTGWKDVTAPPAFAAVVNGSSR